VIATVTPGASAIPLAATLPHLFSNYTRCASCCRTTGIRVYYCPGCPKVAGAHYHRHCPCGATWLERSAGHGVIDLDASSCVLLCQHCKRRVSNERAMDPPCCRTPEVSYHDTREPCDLCRDLA
jgi:hypothetical protein